MILDDGGGGQTQQMVGLETIEINVFALLAAAVGVGGGHAGVVRVLVVLVHVMDMEIKCKTDPLMLHFERGEPQDTDRK